jgi:hypothetical protein
MDATQMNNGVEIRKPMPTALMNNEDVGLTEPQFIELCFRASEGGIEPLCSYLETDPDLTAENKENLAWLIRRVHTYGMPRKRGRRAATRIGPVESAEHRAASIVRLERERWRTAHGKQRLGKGLRDELIKKAIARVEKSNPKVKEKVSADNVRTLLKSNR